MNNIHILPTDKPSRLVKNNLGLIRVTNDFTQKDLDFIKAEFVNIYITSDEEIKEGDWVKNISFEEPIFKVDAKGFTYVTLLPHLKFKKVVLTSDQDLIKDGVQAIDDEFLEWFVKNPSCEEVEVEQDITKCKGGLEFRPIFGYKIIIPKEEPKQETLEEVAENYVDSFEYGIAHPRRVCKNAFINGSKWQQERSYSEKEVLVLLHKRDAYNFKTNAKSLQEWETPKEWFEQFKNK